MDNVEGRRECEVSTNNTNWTNGEGNRGRMAIRDSCDSCNSWLKKGTIPNAHQPFREESYRIVGACFEVYNELGSGFLEPVYQEALGLEFCGRSIPFVAKRNLDSEPQRDLCSLQ